MERKRERKRKREKGRRGKKGRREEMEVSVKQQWRAVTHNGRKNCHKGWRGRRRWHAFAVLDEAIASTSPSVTKRALRLACPVTLLELSPTATATSSPTVSFTSPDGYEYTQREEDTFLDLTIESRASSNSYIGTGIGVGLGVETFRSPIVSFLYERGWRQSFARAGFPGVDEEFKTALRLLLDGNETTSRKLIVDLSCGSGLFTRRFIKSGEFDEVVALDYSEAMLRETKQRLTGNGNGLDSNRVLLVRGDVSRLPFMSSSVPYIHAGAALHCWPSPLTALAEIYRVMEPTGVFVATTFLHPLERISELSGYDERVKRGVGLGIEMQRQMSGGSRGVGRTSGNGSLINYWREEDLRSLMYAVGFVEYESIRNGQYIMVKAKKQG